MLSFLFMLIGLPFIILFIIGFLTYEDKNLPQTPTSPSPTPAPSPAPTPPPT
jgi:hypothetical protein